MRRLTNEEVDAISQRVDEINEAVDLCDADHDADVLDNLERELEHLVQILEASYQLALRAERGPKLRICP